MALSVGEVVADYEIVQKLGQGALSETYKAVSRRDGSAVVLKFPNGALIGDPQLYQRFERELTIGQKMVHPNIQRAIALVNSPVGVFLALDFAEGVEFRRYLEQHAPLPLDSFLKIAEQLAGALAYAHKQGVYHRDLKPENLIISDDGSVHIVDFGIALLEGARRLTWRMMSETMGTPSYMAPEQIQGKRGDARTDIYALGIMMYEMLTGVVPFEADNPLAVMNQHLTQMPKPPHTLNPAILPPIESIVMKAMRKNPDERYQNAEALLSDLRNFHDLDLTQFMFRTEHAVGLGMAGPKAMVLLGVGVAAGFILAVVLLVVLSIVLRGR